MERLQKVIANCGVTSRRKAEELIVMGKVFVNGEKITELGYKVSDSDVIMVDGVVLEKTNKEYYLLNKPRGYICAVSDDLGRKVVTDLIDTETRIYPVGRLDYDTTGLIILTNDGEFANKLMHPSFKVMKTYVAKIDGILKGEDIYKLKKGILIDGTKCVVDKIKVKKIDKEKNTSIVVIGISVGINHVVKRLFKAIGYEVLKLKRESIGFFELGNLQSGEYRMLDDKEVKKVLAINNGK